MIQVDTEIRRATEFNDYKACMDLQRKVWGFAEESDLPRYASLGILMIANRTGGSVLIAQETSGRIIGFSFAMLGKKADGTEIWWSYMTAVISEYRNKDIGLRLKLRQREEALQQGIPEIHWTFDPLQSVNGYFNIHKLGAIVRSYLENEYGVTTSALHHGLPTDRFLAEWGLNSDRVKERIDSDPSIVLRDLDAIPRINPGGKEPQLDYKDDQLLVEIPADVSGLNPTQIENWQKGIRMACRCYFAAGYAVTDFIKVDDGRDEAFYLFSRTSAA